MIKLTVTSANDGWARVRFVCDGKHEEKPYFLGDLAPHSDDLPELIEGFKLAGWIIEDKRQAKISHVQMGNS